MSIEHKVQNETGRNPYRIGVNVLLLVAFFLLFHPLLSKGSLMYQPTISHWLTAGAFVPLVLRPWRRNHPFAENHTRLYAAVLLVHDVLLFLSAAAVSLILVEYMVKGCVITLKQMCIRDRTYTVKTLDELKAAIEDSKKQTVSTLIDMKVLPKTMSAGYEAWWRVGVAEVSQKAEVQAARKRIEDHLFEARHY